MPILFGQAGVNNGVSSSRAGAPTVRATEVGLHLSTPLADGLATDVNCIVNEGANGVYQVRVDIWDGLTDVLLGTAIGTPMENGTFSFPFSSPVSISTSGTYRVGVQVSSGLMRLAQLDGTSQLYGFCGGGDPDGTTTPPFALNIDPYFARTSPSINGSLTKAAVWIVDETPGVTILEVSPPVIGFNSTPEITGAGFGATPSAVLLSPTNDRTDVNAVAQTIGAGATFEYIPLTGVALPVGTTNGATLYYFVQAEDLSWSDGFAVTYGVQPTLTAPETFNPTLDGFSFRFTTDTANGTAIWAAYATTTQRNAATIADIQAEITTPATSLARGQFTVTVAGVQTVSAITGLGAAQTRHIRVFHDGDVTV